MVVIAHRLPRRVNAEIRRKFGRSKYGNIKVKLDGITFDSLKERDRYLILLMRQKLGEISGLEVHPRFKLEVNGGKVCTYCADFQYFTCHSDIKGSTFVVEDVKGVKTAVYKLKKRLMKALLNIEIREA